MTAFFWPIFWMVLIFFFSTDAGSFSTTSHYIDPILRFFYPEISSREIYLTHGIVRKLAHLIEYAILSCLWFIALNRGRRRWSVGSALWALGFSILYASLDEFHQAFVRSRTASLMDIGIDTAGAFMGQTILYLTSRQPPAATVVHEREAVRAPTERGE